LSELLAGDLSPSKGKRASYIFSVPLDAALLWRQVAKASKAVTSHRTPKSSRAATRLRRYPATKETLQDLAVAGVYQGGTMKCKNL